MAVNSRKKKITPEVEKNLVIGDSSEIKKEREIVKKSYLKIVVVVVCLVVLVVLLKNFLIVAIVDNKPIWRLTLVRELEKQAGKQVLDGLIANTVILNEANKRGITVSAKDIDNELTKIDSTISQQGQTLDQVLALQGMTRDDLRSQLKLKLAVEKLVEKDVTVTDKDVDNYIAQNKDAIPADAKIDQARASIKEQLRQQKINEQAQKLYIDLKAKAKIIYLINY